ncbi:MAG TPA: GNAT family N-acetyltransferase [Terriglobales bacterium]|nr:GNAT family N-acetyltransferase [Terriglobales bacterium]
MSKEATEISVDKHKLCLKKINSTQEFRELKDKWDSFLEQSSSPNIFLTWEWLFTWWELYSKGYQLFVLLALDQNENILGIVPLCLTRLGPLRLKVLKFLGTKEVCSDHLDFILRKGSEKETFNLFLDYLEENPKEWDLLDLTDFREGSSGLAQIQTWAEKNRFGFSINLWTVCPYAILTNEWENFLGGLSANSRKDIRRQLRLMEESGKIRFSSVKDRDEVMLRMDDLFRLHSKRWSALGEMGVFQRERFNRFHKKIAELFFEKGWLSVSYLANEENIFAIYYNFQYLNKIYAYQSGIDPDWENFSPGTVALALTIREAIFQGFREFDFLRGDASYKYKWTEKERKNQQVLVWNKNFRSLIYKNFLSLLEKSKNLAKRYLPDFVIKVLKYFWQKAGFAGE